MSANTATVTADLGKIALESPSTADTTSEAYPFYPLAYRTQSGLNDYPQHKEEIQEGGQTGPDTQNMPGPTVTTKFLVTTALLLVIVGMLFLIPNPVFGLFLMFLGAATVITAVFMPMKLIGKDLGSQH